MRWKLKLYEIGFTIEYNKSIGILNADILSRIEINSNETKNQYHNLTSKYSTFKTKYETTTYQPLTMLLTRKPKYLNN